MATRRAVRRILAVASIAAASALAAYAVTSAPVIRRLLEPLENTTLDWRVRNAARNRARTMQADSSQIRLVLFDSISVQQWPYLVPFPRSVLADLIDEVSKAGAKVIGLDVYLDRVYPELASLGNGDERLHDAMQRAGNVVLVAPTEDQHGRRVIRAPHPYFASVAGGIGIADLPTPFETVRETYLTVRTDRGRVPGFALALYAQSRGIDVNTLLSDAERTGVLHIPSLPAEYARLDKRHDAQILPILFEGPPSRTDADDGAFRAYSAGAIMALRQMGASVPPEWFRGRTVLLGTGFHESDRYRTPFYDDRPADSNIFGWTYGVEVAANAVENLLTGRHPAPLSRPATLALLLVCALLVALVAFRFGVGLGAVAGVFTIGVVAAFAFMQFDATHLQIPIVSPALATVLSFLGATSYISIVEGKDKRLLRSAFGKYLSPQLVDELVADPSRLKLGGEKRTITILFSDLAGFTSLSESMEPEQLVSLLNEYLETMSGIVIEEGGTLDKYIGDAVMAFYGAPTFLADHALRACHTALQMQRELARLNVGWSRKGLAPLRMRVGVNTGTPVVGNIGGERRFDYTALGDPVNLAARLEPACRTYGVQIIIAEDTRRLAGNAIKVRELEMLAVYGKDQPVAVYELLALAGEDPGVKAELLEMYNRGLAAYRDRDFELALRYFEAAEEIDPKDGPTQLYVERCREYNVDPPPADWDFVERRQIK